PNAVEIEPVEFPRVFFERRVAARDDVVDDGAHGRLDVGRGLALAVEKGAELPRKIGAARIEANCHELSLEREANAYQHSVLITILIFGFLIDKNAPVAQLHAILLW